jgi:haloacetate dehalogenase
MVHGFPRTSLMWRSLAPKLTDTHTVICVDLRAYGRTGIPPSTHDHFPYSKRAMAQELLEVMVTLGFPTFTLIGHDRGGRVSYRLALDHPKNVERLAVFDVIPILEAWSRSDARFAQTYWPWILLAQKESLPERYLLGAPKAAFDNPFGHGSFGPDILEEYVSTYRDPARVHGICEEYRAAATIDVEHDRVDKEASKRIECPLLHPMGRAWPARHFLCKRWRSTGHLAAMGSARARAGNEGWPLLPGRESGRHRSSRQAVPLRIDRSYQAGRPGAVARPKAVRRFT